MGHLGQLQTDLYQSGERSCRHNTSQAETCFHCFELDRIVFMNGQPNPLSQSPQQPPSQLLINVGVCMLKQPPKYDQLVVRKARHDLSLKSHQSRHHPGTIINIIISISSHLSIIVSTSIITSAMTRALEVINQGTNQAQSSSPSLSKYHRHHNHRQHHEHQHHHENIIIT